MMKHRITLFAALSALAFCASAVAQDPPPAVGGQQDGKMESPAGLKLTVSTDKPAYGTKDKIAVTLTLKNTSRSSITLQFATAQRFDLRLARPVGNGNPPAVVWQWARGMMFAQVLGNVSIEPGKSSVFKATITPSAAPPAGIGSGLVSGKYTLMGNITTMGAGAKPSAVATFTIK